MLLRLTVAALRRCARIDHQSKQMHGDRNAKKCHWSGGIFSCNTDCVFFKNAILGVAKSVQSRTEQKVKVHF